MSGQVMIGPLTMGSFDAALLGWCFGFGMLAFAEDFDFRFGADCFLSRGGRIARLCESGRERTEWMITRRRSACSSEMARDGDRADDQAEGETSK